MEKSITRREFFKKSAMSAAALRIAGLGLIGTMESACSTAYIKEDPEKLSFPDLEAQPWKVQVPSEGHYFGMHPGWAGKFTFDKEYKEINYLGVEPKIVVPNMGRFEHVNYMMTAYKREVRQIIEQGSIYHYFFHLSSPVAKWGGLQGLLKSDEFKGEVKKLADFTAKLEVPIFITTLRELNGNWFNWGRQPSAAKDVWRMVKGIFDERGATNATWVWEIYVPVAGGTLGWDYDEYYPGDEHVDWIGLSSFSRKKYPATLTSFGSLVSGTYNSMRSKHPTKPVYMSEFGRTRDSSQARWLKNAYATMKNKMPAMKASTLWDNSTPGYDNHTLTERSYVALRKIVKDPYFIAVDVLNKKP